jgi:2,4-diketo-3-deoxy-L-fuconate hydrolase
MHDASPPTYQVTTDVSSFTPAGPTADWEIDLVTVIGKRACRVPREEGWDYIAGLTAPKDLSGRTIQTRGALPRSAVAKSFPGSSRPDHG